MVKIDGVTTRQASIELFADINIPNFSEQQKILLSTAKELAQTFQNNDTNKYSHIKEILEQYGYHTFLQKIGKKI